MAKEYIEREAAIQYFKKRSKSFVGHEPVPPALVIMGCANEVDAIPAADVAEVVRCKDCVHYDNGENDSEAWEYCKVLAKDAYDNFYCKLGKRREVQHDN